MTRVCFQLQVQPERLDQYLERHSAVWPRMLEVIAASGRRNYSLFVRPDGMLIGYYETESIEDSQAFLDASTVASEWEAEMAQFFVALDGRPDQAALVLHEVFNLEDQLAAAKGGRNTD